jgi:SecD/SecF fusion protein
VSIYQLSFHFANKVKNDAKAFAAGNSKEARYLDSIGKENVFNLGFTNFNLTRLVINKSIRVLT